MSEVPSADQMRFAAEWVDNYEASPGDTFEAEASRCVADWLRARAQDMDRQEVARGLAKKHRVDVATARRVLNKSLRGKESPDALLRAMKEQLGGDHG